VADGPRAGVAELATEAGQFYGLPQADVPGLRRAAFVHDIGRLGVSNAIWDKPAGLTRSELERVRLHPYLTERMLSFSAGLDGAAVDAVLRAAGHRVRRRREWPAGLTAREVEIVRLLVRGLTTRAIARQLVISPKTASSHIEHIYAKTGVANRAQLSLFALKSACVPRRTPVWEPRSDWSRPGPRAAG
jgi:DNA-binding CsgD family transcriptional regulator